MSLVAGSAAFVLLYRLAAARLGAAAAQRTVLFLALAPTSLFFGAVYSESLFLLLAVATFLTAEKGSFWKAGGLAGLALLTRSAGIALLPALVVFAWRAPSRRRALAGVAVAPALFAALPAAPRSVDRRPLAFLDAQKVVWERHLSPAGPIGGLIAAVQDRQVLDLAVAALVARARRARLAADRCPIRPLCPRQRRGAARRRIRSKAPLLSMQRFVIVAFPAFMALATVVRTRRATFVTATILSAALVVYVVRWALWYWVA